MIQKKFYEEEIRWRDLGKHCKGRYLVFRGMRRSEWELKTSLELTCLRTHDSLIRADQIEADLLREFRRRLHHYSVHPPKRFATIQWLSLMQHYGAPTRLLDWTYSWQVAAYFAFENMTDDDKSCAVWAVNGVWSNTEAHKAYATQGKPTDFLKEQLDEDIEASFHNVVMTPPHVTTIFPITPFFLDERLTIQKGVFLCPGDATKTFDDNLRALPDHRNKANIRKLIMPLEDRNDAIRDLDGMNINRATLFPGLDGFAQSLKIYHYSLDPR